MATKKQRFRTACKVSSVSSAGYCVATASDNLSSDEDCVDCCIYAVKVIRALPLQRTSEMSTSRIYELMGDAYRMIGSRKHGRAANCYILSLKEMGGGGGEWGEDGRSRVKEKLRDVGGVRRDAEEKEIESVLDNHRMLGVEDKWEFNCTGCGECCRTADNILVTPFDLFNMTRSPSLSLTTSSLKNHPKFGHSLKYMLKDDVPVCYLSPVRSETGRCHFAYELVKVGGELLGYEETMEVEKRRGEEEGGEEEYVPVTADEYNLTEEEEMEAARGIEDGWEEEEEEEEEEELEENGDYVLSPPSHVAVSVLNSYSKAALGCMLGTAGMPSMCAAYPMANESVWGDFWHERKGDIEEKLDGLRYREGKREEGGMEGWLKREKFVVVSNDVCEGFFEEGKPRTEAYDIPKVGEKETTVEDFLTSSTNLGVKESEKAWFLSLHAFCTSLKITSPAVRKIFVEHMARIWFNFDSLPTARRRPFKSWGRVKTVIEECSKTLVENTGKFQDREEGERGGNAGGDGGGNENNVGARYKELLKRLNL